MLRQVRMATTPWAQRKFESIDPDLGTGMFNVQDNLTTGLGLLTPSMPRAVGQYIGTDPAKERDYWEY